MAKCERCGATLAKKAAFCTVCGTPVPGARTATQARPRVPTGPSTCRNCGRSLKPGQKFCTSCGAPIAQTPAPPTVVTPTSGQACPHCGYSRNPPDSFYCINCGQSLASAPISERPEETSSDEARLPEAATTLSCSACGREAKPNSKFCIYCGGALITASTPTEDAPVTTAEPEPTPVTTVDPIPVPTDVLASLMARGRQLAIEEEYAANGAESDALLDELSQAAANSDFELEELIDIYINERAELERLETLHEKSEVSNRVYERLKGEYENKLASFDEKIQTGVYQLQGYLAKILQEYAQVQEELETIKARELIGDDEPTDASQKKKLEDKAKRYDYAIAAARYILQKEATMRNGPVSRFEITETTLTDTKIKSKPSDKPAKPTPADSAEPEDEEPTAPASQPEPEAGKICTVCGRITASNAKFCVHCGSPL